MGKNMAQFDMHNSKINVNGAINKKGLNTVMSNSLRPLLKMLIFCLLLLLLLLTISLAYISTWKVKLKINMNLNAFILTFDSS